MFKKNVVVTLMLALALFSASAASAATSTDEYADAKSIITARTACAQLSQEQLEKVGDYYMEQMMPGQAHKNMEQALGGEGSESLKQAHIFMARRWYCGDATGYGMMGMMVGNSLAPGTGGYGMMGGTNFGSYGQYGSMMGFGYNSFGPIALIWLSGIFVVVGIAALVKYLLKKS